MLIFCILVKLLIIIYTKIDRGPKSFMISLILLLEILANFFSKKEEFWLTVTIYLGGGFLKKLIPS